MTSIGYARVSTADQDPELQLSALRDAGCNRIFEERVSGTRADRPELAACLDYVREGDTLVVWRLDRLGRSVRHLIDTVVALGDRGVEFRSLGDSIDTSTASGKLIFHVLSAIAEFESSLISERTRAGLEVARARGRELGPKRVMTAEKLAAAKAMIAEGGYTMGEIASAVEVSRASLYRSLPGGRS